MSVVTRPSPIAFPAIKAGLSATVSFDDEWAEKAMRLLAAEGIVAGDYGAVSLATLFVLVDRRPDLRGALNLGSEDVALVIVTEGRQIPSFTEPPLALTRSRSGPGITGGA